MEIDKMSHAERLALLRKLATRAAQQLEADMRAIDDMLLHDPYMRDMRAAGTITVRRPDHPDANNHDHAVSHALGLCKCVT